MTTFSIVIVPTKRLANGKHRIRIAVAHQAQTRYIATPFILDSISQLKKGRVVRHENAAQINLCLQRTINEYILILSSIKHANQLTCTQLIHSIQEEERKKYLTFDVIAKEFLSTLQSESRIKSYKLYKTAISHFNRFLKKEHDIPLEQIRPSHIHQYQNFLEKRELSSTTVRIYLTLIKVILNYAIKMDYIHYKVHPFAACILPSSRIRNLDLTVDELKSLRDVSLKEQNLLIVRDLFMLTYYLGGINLKDLLDYHFEENNLILSYIRHKTYRTKHGENEIVFSIQPEAQQIISKYRTDKGFLKFGPYESYNKVYSLIYRYLTRIAREAGITSSISYYSARKSFAQHGYNIGIQIETIEYCIGHSMKSNRPIGNYIRVMRSHADIAMRRIFDELF
ncbi:tyrosine-type recombinase/integrase [Phocaeicola plebeius]|jgi:site-specific recombinase XerD|uniref:Recombinase n=2 Tax=Phocaeicola TaxID=909656 RepID=A0A414FVJ1_9BACT|nr:site-specific integrase [Phocaeicola plebeius]RHD55161.1 recombinase [Phocaeicola plebeius]RHL00307.1 recombinase [Phocaeicola plebeius]RHL18624.1 recombinase [Phocaeicola plebeius]